MMKLYIAISAVSSLIAGTGLSPLEVTALLTVRGKPKRILLSLHVPRPAVLMRLFIATTAALR